jgi:predicted DsbA family dithiol-disulfide isomerase
VDRKKAGADAFYSLHTRLYEAYFVHGRSIGEEAVLRELALASGMDEEFIDQAWNSADNEKVLQQNMTMAVQAGVTGTPTFFIGERRLVGAVSLELLQTAAAEAIGKQSATQ